MFISAPLSASTDGSDKNTKFSSGDVFLCDIPITPRNGSDCKNLNIISDANGIYSRYTFQINLIFREKRHLEKNPLLLGFNLQKVSED